MTNTEQIQKSIVTISLPRAFYDFYMDNRLYNEFSSFSDWVRHAVREDRKRQESRLYSESLKKSESDF